METKLRLPFEARQESFLVVMFVGIVQKENDDISNA